MPDVRLNQGTIRYRAVGPDAPGTPTVVFVHGLLVDGRLWDGVADRLAAQGVRCIQPNLPLGAHELPMDPGTDFSFPAMAKLVNEFIDALKLSDVTLVGNDSGGAICQFLIDTDHSRIGRLVLTNCDAYTNFPPYPFNVLVKVARHQAAIGPLMASMRSKRLRHSDLGVGLLANHLDDDLVVSWMQPTMSGDKAIRRDTALFCAEFDPAELDAVSTRLGRFDKPVKIIWGQADRCFKPEYGRRLAKVFPNASLTEVPNAKTFVALDNPGAVADGIMELVSV
ncbi:alpha/beta fold hydrolase [Antrihabitans cavernicola]|uniref:Alpha/beta hydrolase n=1 Tax=Antrihabitans cavernicola TaxID=2495913 RepID=A0A5A7SG94_9NOCA|nr:alpha/beta hydrolase [Spelaeibacter cavernicola]KAA0024846.1 alpha/beta hydrolase [Spelaeibacter cavernicola]